MRVGRKQRVRGFGAALRAFRARVRLSQEDLAEILGLSQRTISTYEKRGILLLPDQLARLGEATKADISPLMQIAGYGPPGGQQEAVAESQMAYRVDPGKISDVVELIVRVNIRTGEVLGVESRGMKRKNRR